MPRRSTTSYYWRDKTWHPPIRDLNKIHSLRSSDGHVPHRSTSFLDHANWKMVKHSLPQIHLEANSGVFARHLLKNDRGSVFQTHSYPTGKLWFLILCNAFSREGDSLFFASCRTRLHRISQPVPSTKVESKNPQTHPGNIIAERNRNKTYIGSGRKKEKKMICTVAAAYLHRDSS